MATHSTVAGGTIRRCRFVFQDSTTDFRVVEGTANCAVTGISQQEGRTAAIPSETADPPQAAQAGEALNIYQTPGDIVLLEIGTGGITRGDLIESASDGTGITALTTVETVRNIGARAVESAAAGELARVEIFFTSKTLPA
jgi:hypothetical protein